MGHRRAFARHVVWRPAEAGRRPLLVVADAEGRVTFWVSAHNRVNVWNVEFREEVDASVVAMGWTKGGGAVAAVLSNGGMAVWMYPDVPLGGERDRSLRLLMCKNAKMDNIFGGEVKCAYVAPGEKTFGSVAIVAVLAGDPQNFHVRHASLSKTDNMSVEISQLGKASLSAKDGDCVACYIVPSIGSLYTVDDKGFLAKWTYSTSGVPSSAYSPWKNKAKRQIYNKTAITRMVNGRLVTSTNPEEDFTTRKVYACAVSHQGARVVTVSDEGIKVFNGNTLDVVADFGNFPIRTKSGHSSGTYLLKKKKKLIFIKDDAMRKFKVRNDDDEPENAIFWGLGLSPLSCVAMAVTSSGIVYAIPLPVDSEPINPRLPDAPAPTMVTDLLLKVTSGDGLRGSWDILSTIVTGGIPRARKVLKNLRMSVEMLAKRTHPSGTKLDSQKFENLNLAIYSLVDRESFVLSNARKLMWNAVTAISSVAPPAIREKLSTKSPTNQIMNANYIMHEISTLTSSLPRQGASAASCGPLCDWILVFGSFWLRTCARVVSNKIGLKEMGKPWAEVVSTDNIESAQQRRSNSSIITDRGLISRLRSTTHGACLMLGVMEENRDPESEGRYFQIPKTEMFEIVATVWDVSLSLEMRGSSASMGGEQDLNGKFAAAAVALSRHKATAKILSSHPELGMRAAERALGLLGSRRGAGWLMTKARGTWVQSAADASEKESEWSPFDVVTGRPLPPWTPLRRCVYSGLLAAETSKTHGPANPAVKLATNEISPWAETCNHQSPFGGMWARVPSLDLGRFELLPAVSPFVNRPHYPRGSSKPPQFPNGMNGMSIQQAQLHQQQQHQQLQIQQRQQEQQHQQQMMARHRVANGNMREAGGPIANGIAHGNQGLPGMMNGSDGMGTSTPRLPTADNNPSLATPKMNALGMPMAPTTPLGVGLDPQAKAVQQQFQFIQRMRQNGQSPSMQDLRLLESPQPRTPQAFQAMQGMEGLGLSLQDFANQQQALHASQMGKNPQPLARMQGMMNGVRMGPGTPGGNLSLGGNSGNFASGGLQQPGMNGGIPGLLNPAASNMTTASLTTEVGSTTSRGRKRGSGRGRRKRSTDGRKSGQGGTQNDTMSTDTRSTVTNSNFTDTGVTQDINKPRKRRRRSSSQNKQAAAANQAHSGTGGNPGGSQDTSAFPMSTSPEDILINGSAFPSKLGLELPLDIGLGSSAQLTSPTASAVSGRNAALGRIDGSNPFQTQDPLRQSPNALAQQLGLSSARGMPLSPRAQAMGPPAPPAGSNPTPMAQGLGGWRGKLQLHDQSGVRLIECIATNQRQNGRKGISSFDEWPSVLHCDLTQVKPFDSVKGKITDPAAEWYVKVSPLPSSGSEHTDVKFAEMVRLVAERKAVFEIELGDALTSPGTLFLFGYLEQPMGRPTLLGVYKPKALMGQDNDPLMSLVGG